MKTPTTMMNVRDVIQATGVGETKAYEIIQKLNTELEKMGKMTIRGKVNRKFFEEKFYL